MFSGADKNKVGPNPIPNSTVNEPTSDSIGSDPFELRPIYPNELEARPSVFRVVAKLFHDAFRSISDGFRNAWSAIQHAFGSPDSAATALRHIREEVTVPESAQEQTTIARGSLKASPSEDAVSIKVNLLDAVVIADDVPLVDADEVSFSRYLTVYTEDQRNGVKTVCPQNFRDGATKHAKKLFDNEVQRCTKFSDKPNEYFLAVDDDKKIKAAAALLNKTMPHPASPKFGEAKKVAGHSVEQFSSFLAWREWKTSGKLPEGGNIDLGAAKQYADSFIGAHVSHEDLGNKQVQNELKDAFKLIAEYEKELLDLDMEMLLFSVEDAKQAVKVKPEAVQSLSPPAPPPPRAGAVSVSAPPPPPPRLGAVSVSPPAPPPPRVRTVVPEPKTDGTAQRNAHAASVLQPLSSLTGDEVARGVRSFSKFVEAFTKASSEGGVDKLLDETEYLTPACVAMANAFFESVAFDPDVKLMGANLIKFQAASYLKNAATKIQRAKPQ